MTKLIFEGVVRDVDNECRVGSGEEGSIYIGDRDVVAEIHDANFTKNIIVGIADETFSGENFVETGWGYSESTPMDEDKLCVGDHDLLEILKRYEGQKITMFVSEEPINILEKLDKNKILYLTVSSNRENNLVLEFPASLYLRFLEMLIELQQESYELRATYGAQYLIAEIKE